jgi:crotonobetainyl-CoA:carnitine CoA-transferase CaiB-like acyl-CoA transferase
VTVDPPLSGIRVLDFTRFLAGPFCTQQLGDLGADVIKVESPNRGREFSSADGRDTYFFLSANRSKRSLGLDIEKPEGVELLLRLLPRFDVLVENFRPGVMDRFGLGPARLTEHHPRLVYVSISGFGSTGPYRDRPGFDQIAQGMSGVMSLTGTPETGPLRHGLAIGDLVAGLYAAQGALAALQARERTGRGQHVETSLLEGLIGILTWGAGMYFEAGRVPGPAGHHHPLSSPYGRFRASDGYVNIAAGGQHIWERLCSALDREDWKQDPRFADPGSRLRNRDTLSSELEKELARATVGEWVERINAAGVPCGPVYTMDQVFEDPQVVARDMCVELPHPVLGKFRTTGLPLKFDQTAARVERRPPLLGEHTDEILEELDVSKSERSTLRENRIIGS